MDALFKHFEEDYFFRLDGKLNYLLDSYTTEELAQHVYKWFRELDTQAPNFAEQHQHVLLYARELFISSDFSRDNKDSYFKALKDIGFFQLLSKSLYSNHAGICSYAIFTFGKFTHPDNSHFLEKAFESRYRTVDPSLSARCLSELSWLGSPKVEQYIQELEQDTSVWSKLILVLHYSIAVHRRTKYEALICNDELIKLIAPYSKSPSRRELETRLTQFDITVFPMIETDDINTRSHYSRAMHRKFFEEFT